MQIQEVKDTVQARQFLEVNAKLYKGDPNYIRPLDKDIEDVFNPAVNKAFSEGQATRWILLQNDGTLLGRIAAFVLPKYKNKGDKFRVGCLGFFDCVHHQQAANLLFDTAKEWLETRGVEAMDGPVNFGERDKWWGLLVDGFTKPLYGMNYNFPYYAELFETYGFRRFYYQNCYSRNVRLPLENRFYEGHKKLMERGGFEARMLQKNQLDVFARDFVKIYNAAWAIHEGNKEMTEEAALKLFKKMKPIIDPRIAWFVYYKNEPVALYINIPDLNQIFGKFKGQFGWWQKLQFFIFLKTRGFSKMVGIIFGVVPRFQSLGVDYFMIVEAARVIQQQTPYTDTELQWIGDFNPKINNIAKHLGFSVSRRLATYRYLFNRDEPFERHPQL